MTESIEGENPQSQETCKYSRDKIYRSKYSEKAIIRSMARIYLENMKDNNFKANADRWENFFIFSKNDLEALKNQFDGESNKIEAIETFMAERYEGENKGGNNKELEKECEVFQEQAIKDFEVVIKGKTKDIKLESVLIRKLVKDSDKSSNSGTWEFKYPITSAGFFEKHFHTIINPEKYGHTAFMRIFNYYWSCYFSIVNSLLDSLKSKSGSVSTNQEEKHVNVVASLLSYASSEENKNKKYYKNIIENIVEFTKLLYSPVDPFEGLCKDSYYDYIHRTLAEKNENYECVGVLTTNYYRFVERVWGKENIAYLNGQLRYFQIPNYLEVVNVADEDVSEGRLSNEIHFFPFIFGQSMLKPIVDMVQIDHFYKANEILEKADVLVILGYNMNEDDNHINALLHRFVTNSTTGDPFEKKKIIFVTSEEEENCNMHERMRAIWL